MPIINVVQPFKFAHDGYLVEEFGVGEVETTEECASIAMREGWAVEPGKAHGAAPENRDASARRGTKAKG